MVWHELIQVSFDWGLVIVNYIYLLWKQQIVVYADLIFYAISIERDNIIKILAILGSERFICQLYIIV